MPDKTADFRLNEIDAALACKLAVAENLFLTAATAIAALNIIAWLSPWANDLLRRGASPMNPEAAMASVLIAASLHLSRPRYRRGIQSISMLIALVVSGCSTLVLAEYLVSPASWVAGRMEPPVACCLVLTGFATLVIRVRGRLGAVSDLATFCLLFVVAVLVSGRLMGGLGIFGPVKNYVTSGQTTFCFLLLAGVVFIRRAQSGLFLVLLGPGIGSKVARIVAPVLVALPYFREAMRAHLINFRRMPPHYTTALLATMAAAVSIALLMYLAWRLNDLETEIHCLSLRDPLTGLYNLRGFKLLAEQALLLARRSGQPYSVLFIDVDNLKQINDGYGHQTGSDLLASTADLLRQVFRETDVLGRMGGDEFAVAGQFSHAGIAEATERLRRASRLYNASAERAMLNFSAGWVTSDQTQRVHLTELLAKADEAMYRDKRRRKAAAAGRLRTDPVRPGPHEDGEEPQWSEVRDS